MRGRTDSSRAKAGPSTSERKNGIVHRLPGTLVRSWHALARQVLPDWSFITVHYLYFLTVCFVTSLLFWGASTPARAVSYIDSLFLVVSAMTEAGLNTVNLSQLNTFQQVILFILIVIGSAIWVSIATVHVRKRAFEQKLQELADKRKKNLGLSRSFHISLSKVRRQSGGQREAAIATGAIRGRPILNHEGNWVDDQGTETKAGIPSIPLDLGTTANQSATQQQSQTSSDTVPQHELSPLASDGHLYKNELHAVNEGDTRHVMGLSTTQSLSPTEKVRIVESTHPRNRDHDLASPVALRRSHTRIFSGGGVGAHPDRNNHPRNATPLVSPYVPVGDEEKALGEKRDSTAIFDKYLKGFNGLVGRNSQFHGLSEKERRELGGLEYDALTLLSYLVPTYFFLFQLAGAIGVGAWMQLNLPDVTRTNGLNPFWTGSFFAISAFNNSGMALLDINAIALQTSYYCLLTLGFLILAGNTCFPPFLRLILWTAKVSIPSSWKSHRWEVRRKGLQFLLDHPRRCYTHLFPSHQTWWLVGTLVVLNGIDWVAFEILNIGNPAIELIPPRFRVLNGLFQAFAVRSGGFYVVNIAQLRPGLLCLYIYMMYLSALPVTLTLRNTNIYEERSLGIFAKEIAHPPEPPPSSSSHPEPDASSPTLIGNLKRHLTNQATKPTTTWSRRDFLRQQFRGQLSHDVWWIALAVLLITIIETPQSLRDPVNFSVFNILFECVSAYGCVGISVGVPWNSYSFCGAWHTTSKLVLCAVMLRGRHRGLPVAVDRAVLVPSERLGWAEEEDAVVRGRRRSRSVGPLRGGDM